MNIKSYEDYYKAGRRLDELAEQMEQENLPRGAKAKILREASELTQARERFKASTPIRLATLNGKEVDE